MKNFLALMLCLGVLFFAYPVAGAQAAPAPGGMGQGGMVQMMGMMQQMGGMMGADMMKQMSDMMEQMAELQKRMSEMLGAK